MSRADTGRRAILFISAAILLIVTLFYISGGYSTVPDTLPLRLTDKEFWNMVEDFSEAGGYFRSDNFLSNESGYQSVIPLLRKTVQPGGIYLGVGPEQNFTYVVAVEPKMAFVVDIRRQNMLEHLLYKALMELSTDRAEFLSRLFCRPEPEGLPVNAGAETLARGYRRSQRDAALLESNTHMVLEYLEKTKGFGLSIEDEAGVRRVYRAFFESGPDLSYTFVGGYGGFMNMPTYAELMTEDDGHTRNWNFLASEGQFRIVQRLQRNNLIIPLVGDFAGPRAIRAVGEYLREHSAVLTVFYTSNVEQYLFQDDANWKRFYANAGTLPLNSTSTFIRYVLNGRGFSRRSHPLLSPVMGVVSAYEKGRIQGYYDVVGISR